MIKWFGAVAAIAAITLISAGGASSYPPAAIQKLTPAQQKKISDLDRKGRAEIQSVQFGLGTPAQKEKRIEAIKKKYQDAELAVLTPTQRAAVEQRRARQKRNYDQIEKVRKTITAQQINRANAIKAAYFKKAQLVVRNKKLTRAQKNQQLRALYLQQNAELKTVLTPAQRAALPQ